MSEHLCKQNGYLGTSNCPQCYQDEISRLQAENQSLLVDKAHLVQQHNQMMEVVRQAQDRAEKAESDLSAALERERVLREGLDKAVCALAGLPHSLGYEFTHLPELRALLKGADNDNSKDCPYAHPHRYCVKCRVIPCPIGLGKKGADND